jgi:hypothetical protein
MVANSVDGRWPWETGEMPAEQVKTADAPEPEIAMYTLPRVKARRGEPADNEGMRPIKASERAKQLKADETEGYFAWR